jgi:hypothetical protein
MTLNQYPFRSRSDVVTFANKVGISTDKRSHSSVVFDIEKDLFQTVFIKPFNSVSIMFREELMEKTCPVLIAMCRELGFTSVSKLRKNQLIDKIHDHYYPKSNDNKFKALLMQRDLFSQHIGCFLNYPEYQLLDWVDKTSLQVLALNPNAMNIIESRKSVLNKPHYAMLSRNPFAMELLIKHFTCIDMNEFATNPTAFPLIEQIIDMDCMRHAKVMISYNRSPSAIAYLTNNPSIINWRMLSSNPSAIHLLEANPDKIHWDILSGNPSAIHLLEANPDKIYWKALSANPSAIHLLCDNPDKIDWTYLSINPSAIPILELNTDKINWYQLSGNPSIFKKSYDTTKQKYYEWYDKLFSQIFTN